jgi:hypothetical protein
MLKEFDHERKEIHRRNEESVRNLNMTIKELKENRTRLEESVGVMNLELETLTRFDKRREAMSDIEGAFEKLNVYINEIDGKKKKTVTMLRKLQLLMDADRGKVIILFI